MSAEHEAEIQEMRDTVAALKDDIAEIKTAMKGLLDAWNAATALVSFIKVAAMIGASVAAIISYLKFGVTHK